jgi:ABC-type multidrug transport system fused ATPase/permease subunit
MKLEEGIGEKVIQFVHVLATCLSCFILAFTMGWQLALVCLCSVLATFVIFGIVTIVSIRSIQALVFNPSPCYVPFMDFSNFQFE